MSSNDSSGPYGKGFALLMWFAWVFGFGGVHRIYLGKPVSGVLYMLTWGLFGIGQIVDLLNMDELVAGANARELAGGGAAPRVAAAPKVKALPAADPKELLRLKLVNEASKHGGKLSVTQGVMATGKTFKEVEKALDEMAKSGYVGIDNHPDTGAVIYVFGQLE